MSVEFSNAYQEILLDNLVAIIKQNFIFQTQLKITENSGKEKGELETKVSDLLKEIELLKIQSQETQNYKMRAEQNTSAHEEKSRIQTALNDTMKQLAATKKQLEEKEEKIKIFETKNSDKILELKDYIKILEENVPQSKMKKINPSYKPIEPEVIKIQVADKSTTLDIIPFITESENSKDGSSF
jgi:hypothetical protein